MRQDVLAHLRVAHRDAEPLGLGERGLLVNHLLQDLLVDAQLLQQLLVHVRAVRATIHLDLRLIGRAGNRRP